MIRPIRAGGHDKGQGYYFMRWLVFTATAVALSGCALPPAISIASLAFDLASYSATGKTVTDHGLSMVFQKDCALLRGLEEGEVCVEADSEFASKKPAREAETRGSRRMAFLQEEHNRLMLGSMDAIETGSERALQSIAFIADPDIAPHGPGPLDEVGYLSDGDMPQVGVAYLAQGLRGSPHTPGS